MIRGVADASALAAESTIGEGEYSGDDDED